MSGHEQRPGDYRVLCDFSGFKCWASETVMTWNGFRVHRRFVGSEVARHPQDLVKAVRDDQTVKNPRPEAALVYLPEAITTIDGIPILTAAGLPVTTIGGA